MLSISTNSGYHKITVDWNNGITSEFNQFPYRCDEDNEFVLKEVDGYLYNGDWRKW